LREVREDETKCAEIKSQMTSRVAVASPAKRRAGVKNHPRVAAPEGDGFSARRSTI